MSKPNLQQLPSSARAGKAGTAPVQVLAKGQAVSATVASVAAAKVRQIHKEGEVNISAYFPAEVKASLRMVQAKTGNNVKECLAEALFDLFRKHKVPLSVEPGGGQRHG